MAADAVLTTNPDTGYDLWYSGKHHAYGGSVQVLAEPTGFPLWVSAVRPGSPHDLTAAHELVLPALYPHAARGRIKSARSRAACRTPTS